MQFTLYSDNPDFLIVNSDATETAYSGCTPTQRKGAIVGSATMVQFYNMDSDADDHDQQPAASSDGLAYVVDREPHNTAIRMTPTIPSTFDG